MMSMNLPNDYSYSLSLYYFPGLREGQVSFSGNEDIVPLKVIKLKH